MPTQPQNEVREQMLNHVADWIQTTFGWDDATLGNKAIVEERGRAKGPRPPLPFLTYNFTVFDFPNGMDETFTQGAGNGITGGRRATLSVVGYGEGADELITRLGIATQPESVPGPLTIINLTPVLDISTQDEDVIESRFTKDFSVLYRIKTTEPAFTVAAVTTVRYNNEDYTP